MSRPYAVARRPGQKNCERLSAALQLYSNGEYQKTLQVCRYIYKEDATDTENLILIGATYLQLYQLDLCEFYCGQCLSVDPMCAEAMNNLGACYWNRFEYEKSRDCFEKATTLKPRFALPYSNLGVAHAKLGFPDKALDSLAISLTLDEKCVDSLTNLGYFHLSNGNTNDAIKNSLKALQYDPTYAIPWSNLGSAYYKQKNFEQSRTSLTRALTFTKQKLSDASINISNCGLYMSLPNAQIEEAINLYRSEIRSSLQNPIASGNLGIVSSLQGDHISVSRSLLRRSVEMKTTTSENFYNFGSFSLLHGTEASNRCIKYLTRALTLGPVNSQILNNLGYAILKEKTMSTESLICFANAVDLVKEEEIGFISAEYFGVDASNSNELPNGEAMANLVLLCSELNMYELVIDLFKRFSLTISNPSFSLNFGCALASMNKTGKAVKYFGLSTNSVNKVVQSAAVYNIGALYFEVGRFDQAIFCFKKSLNLDPGNQIYLTALYVSAQLVCDWELLESVTPRKNSSSSRNPSGSLDVVLRRRSCVMDSFIFNDAMGDRQPRYEGDISLLQLAKQNTIISKPDSKVAKRIGYICSCFGNHPIGQLVSGLFRLHNRGLFDVFCYSLCPDDSSFWFQIIREGSDKFVDVSSMGSFELAHLLLQDSVDILVDIDGCITLNHINSFRPNIPECFLPPVRICLYGYQECFLLGSYTHFVVDKTTISWYDSHVPSERIVSMPNSFVVNCFQRELDCADSEDGWQKIVLERTSFGIDDDVFVYACCHSSSKISALLFNAWMKILERVPNSILWFTSKMPHQAETHLRERAIKNSVQEERLIFSELATCEEHERRCELADVILDCEGYESAKVGFDALFSGTPIISCAGSLIEQRIGASILSASGFQSLIVDSLDGYVNLAIDLYYNEQKYISIIKDIENFRITGTCFDSLTWTKDFECRLASIS